MKNLTARKTFSIITLFLLIAIIVSDGLSTAAMLPLVTGDRMAELAKVVGASGLLLMMYIPKFLMLLIFFLLVRMIPKTTWEPEGMSFSQLAGFYCMTYALGTVLNLLGQGISQAAPAGGTEALDTLNKMVGTGNLIGFLIPALIGPVLEELVFRKLMIDRLHHFGESAVILFTALCFGLFHGNLTQFLYAGCVGIFLGYIYCKTRKVIITIVIHMLLNTFSSLLMLFLPSLEDGGSGGKILGMVLIFLLSAALMIIGIVQLIRHLKRKDIHPDDSMPTALAKSEVFPTVYLNVGVILFFLFHIAVIVMDLFNLSLPWLSQAG